MTRNEFEAKFNASYQTAVETWLSEEKIDTILKENLKDPVSTTNLVSSIFLLSLKCNKDVIHSVLSEVLEFDD